MIDLHMHTFFSDGELIPSELVRRAEVIGYKAMAITDHVDISNYDLVVPRIIKAAKELTKSGNITVLPGAEITHAPPSSIKDLATAIRDLGAKVIIVHGESIVEPVATGTNLCAVQADIDILAHPGLVDDETCELAKANGIYFEITSRKGHSLTNGYVAAMAKKYDIPMVLNSDTHSCGDMLSASNAKKVLLGAGLTKQQIEKTLNNSKEIVSKKL